VPPDVEQPAAAPLAAVWTALASVCDPEIPVLSVLDLGIVRSVEECAGTVTVTITPTYSGCPAVKVIEAGILAAVEALGITGCRIQTRLAPAWTTEWMSAAGRAKLNAYGIAPPAQQVIDISGLGRRAVPPDVTCPRCGSRHTQVISQFGSTACKALYRCQDCREPFDYFKCH
jgi:ring-1,2-phenylacetyl-CoA epoxidase subunit PaaD